MKTVFSTIVLSLVSVALPGCGTVMNLHEFTVGPPPEQSCFEPGHHAGPKSVYGGVTFDAQLGADWFRESVSEPPMALGGLYVWCVDLPLSALGDTITLPVTIPASIDRAIHGHYFPEPHWTE